MKKKAAIACCALLSIMILAGCNADNNADNNADSPVKSISEAVKIELLVAETDETVIVTEKEVVRHICDNLVSLKLRKMEYNEPTILAYTLTFYGVGGEQLEVIRIPAHDWIDYGDGYFYSITGGELDRSYIDEIVDR